MKITNKSIVAEFANCLTLFILINIPFILAGLYTFTSRPTLNLDYLLACFLILYSRFAFISIILILTVVDLIFTFSVAYNFQSLKLFIQSFRFIQNLNYFDLANSYNLTLIAAFLTYLVFITKIISKRIKNSRQFTNSIVLTFILCILIDSIAGSSRFSPNRSSTTNNFAGTPLYTLFEVLSWDATYKQPENVDTNNHIKVTEKITKYLNEHKDKKVIFIIIESMGWPVSKEVFQKYYKTEELDKYSIEISKREFKGNTTFGELRFLCGIRADYNHLSPESVKKCIPNLIKNYNLKTKAYHGFSKNMFNRSLWWKTIGFDETYFAEDLNKRHTHLCGSAFRGICDNYIISESFNNDDGDSFTYLLTLETHLPVSKMNLDKEKINECSSLQISDQACNHLNRIKKTLRKITDEIKKSDKRPLVIIIGDHSPPFMNLKDRDLFSTTEVPMIIFSPIP